MENKRYVLDSYALLCFFENEPGADNVHKLLESSVKDKCELLLSVVNLSEVYYTVKRRSGLEAASQSLSLIDSLAVSLVNVNRSLALLAGDIKSETTIALGDCFCAALAKEHSAIVVTGDPEFKKVEGEIQIKWLPKKSQKTPSR
ncbi:type II toxin-antitoxin system VapC family toxin [bacterium]|nr:type II toxin-antitoxin system VapC family toxin [bacterium]